MKTACVITRSRGWLAVIAVSLLSGLMAACTGSASRPESVAEPVAEQVAEPVAPQVRKQPTDEEVMYRVFAAEYQGAEGNLPAAVGEYLEAALRSNDPEIAKRASQVSFAAQAWEQAALATDRWAVLDDQNVSAHEAAALSRLMVGDYFGAEYQLGRLLDLMEDSSEAWANVTQLLAQSGQPDRADQLLNDLLDDRPAVQPSAALYARSQLAARAGDLDRSFELIRQAVELEPEELEYLTWAGRVALNLKLPETGLEYFKRAWKMHPDDHDLSLAYADLLARTNRPEAAREVMKNMTPTPDVMLSRILFELAARDQQAALKLYEQFAVMEFDDAAMNQPRVRNFYRARAAEALGSLAEAIDLYGTVNEGENALPAAIRQAELLAAEDRLEEARTVLTSLRTQPNRMVVEESWLAEARILHQDKQLQAAFDVLELALEQMPGSVAILYSHALLAAELQRVPDAEQSLRRVLAEQPDNAAALNALGYTLADQTDRHEEAEALIRQAFILEPDQAAIVDSMGWIAYRRGRMVEAIRFLKRAWDLDRNAEIAAHLGEVLWVVGEEDAARAVWREGAEVDATNTVLVTTLQRLEVDL